MAVICADCHETNSHTQVLCVGCKQPLVGNIRYSSLRPDDLPDPETGRLHPCDCPCDDRRYHGIQTREIAADPASKPQSDNSFRRAEWAGFVAASMNRIAGALSAAQAVEYAAQTADLLQAAADKRFGGVK